MALKVTLTEQFDWLRIAATDDTKRRLGLTAARYHEAASGRGITTDTMRAALDAFTRFVVATKGPTLGERLLALKPLVEQTATLEDVAATIDAYTNANR